MNFRKENRTLNLTLKTLILNNNKKNSYCPIINQSQKLRFKFKTSNNSSKNKSNNKILFIKKVPFNKIIPLNNYYNSIHYQTSSNKTNISSKINHKHINKLSTNKSINKYSSKKIITEKYSTIYSTRKMNKKFNNNKYEYENNNKSLNSKTKNKTNNLEYYHRINNENIKINKNNNKEKNKVIKDKIGIMLKKKSSTNNTFLKHFREINNYYLYKTNLENKSYRNSRSKINSDSSLSLKKNKESLNNNRMFFKKKLNYIKNKISKKDIRKNFNTITYNYNNYSTTNLINLDNIPHLNRLTINNNNHKIKNPLKLILITNQKNKKLHYKQTYSNNCSNNNTINITIDNSINNIYDNIININKNSNVTFTKVKNNNQIYKKDIINKKPSVLFPRKNSFTKNGWMNHSYQNIIMNYQKRNKTKEKKNKHLGIIIKENLKKIHEKNKKKQLLISLNNIKLNKIKLLGIQEIFSNFSKIKAKSPKFNTPIINTEFNNFNQINYSGRLNRTEDKNIDFFTSMSEKYKNRKSKINEDPQYVYEYFYEILNNLLIDENNYLEKLNLDQFSLIKSKSYINPESRKFFINSLINIQELLNFNERTLFLTTQIFDRYINNILMKKNINIIEENLDIVIVASLIIAAKNEEIKLYSMNNYLNLLPIKYNIHDLEKTEYEILSGLDFNLGIPSMLDFYEVFSLEKKLNKFQISKGLYLLNFILLDKNLAQIPSSLIAYAVIVIVSGKKIQFNKLCEEYLNNGKKKIIKILSLLKDREIINNLCGYIKYLYSINKNSIYNGPFNKFNTPNYYFISSYLDLN